MKKYLFLLVIPLMMFGCGPEKSPEVINLERVRDSLNEINLARDESINDFIKTMNEIEDNLAEIKEKEKIITVTASSEGELSPEQKDRINEDIKLIYDLMVKNKSRIGKLEKQLKSSDIRIAELNKMVQNLTEQLEERNVEISLIKEKLAELHIEIEALSMDNDSLMLANARKDDIIGSQTDEINKKTEEINTAYYVFGSKKELIEQQVITKDGGFVGLGKIVKLMEDFNKDYFTKVDVTQLKEITLNYKKVKLVTTHPSSSYQLVGTEPIEKLVIKDAKEFWGTSKYLVVIVE